MLVNRMPLRSTVVAVFVWLALIAAPGVSDACSCMNPPSPWNSGRDADAVFSGTVIRVAATQATPSVPSAAASMTFDFSGSEEIEFDVDAVWKGPVQPRLVVTTAAKGGGCGFPFQHGRRYLVYAYGDERLSTDLCTRTHELSILHTAFIAVQETLVRPVEDVVGVDPSTGLLVGLLVVLGGAVITCLVCFLIGVIQLRRRHFRRAAVLCAVGCLPVLALVSLDDRTRLPGRIDDFAILGPDSTASLIADLEGWRPKTRVRAAWALADRPNDATESVRALARVMSSSADEDSRIAACWALRRIGPGSAAATLMLASALDDSSVEVSGSAALALAAIGPGAARAVPALALALDDAKYVQSLESRHARLAPGDQAAEWRLEQAGHAIELRREAILLALSAMGEAAEAARPRVLEETLEGSVPWSRRRVIAQIGDVAASVRSLISHLDSDREYVRARAAAALAVIGPESCDAVVPLIFALRDPTPEVRLRAVEALGAIGADAAIAAPHIGAALDDRRIGEQSAVVALIAIGSVDGASALLRVARSAENPDLAETARQALDHWGIDTPASPPAATPVPPTTAVALDSLPHLDLLASLRFPGGRGGCTRLTSAGRRVLVGDFCGNRSDLVDISSGATLRTFGPPEGGILARKKKSFFGQAAAVVHAHIAIGASKFDHQGAVFVFDGITGDLTAHIVDPDPTAQSKFGAVIASDGEQFIVLAPGPNGAPRLHLFDANGRWTRTIDRPVPGCGLGPESAMTVVGGRLVIGDSSCDRDGSQGIVAIIDVNRGTVVRTLYRPRSAPELGTSWYGRFGRHLAVLSNERLVVGDSRVVHLFDLRTGRLLGSISDPQPEIDAPFPSAIAVLPGDRIVVGGSRRHAFVFEPTGELVGVAISPTSGKVYDFGGELAVVGDRLVVAEPQASGVPGLPPRVTDSNPYGLDNDGALFVYDARLPQVGGVETTRGR